MNPIATNYNPAAGFDNGLCEPRGCTNPSATNYDPASAADDGSCIGGSGNEVRCGGDASECSEPEYCASPDELHELQCCSDTPLRGWGGHWGMIQCTVGGVARYASRGDDFSALSCTSDATLSEAQDACAAVGARLCTVAELEAGCGSGTGCGHNGKCQLSLCPHTLSSCGMCIADFANVVRQTTSSGPPALATGVVPRGLGRTYTAAPTPLPQTSFPQRQLMTARACLPR